MLSNAVVFGSVCSAENMQTHHKTVIIFFVRKASFKEGQGGWDGVAPERLISFIVAEAFMGWLFHIHELSSIFVEVCKLWGQKTMKGKSVYPIRYGNHL